MTDDAQRPEHRQPGDQQSQPGDQHFPPGDRHFPPGDQHARAGSGQQPGPAGSSPAEQAPGPAMVDPATEAHLAAAFAAFRDAHRHAVGTPAVESVFTAARQQQRRRHYVAGLAAAAALVLAVGTGALLNLGEQPNNTTAGRHSPDASPTASPSPSQVSPTPTPRKQPDDSKPTTTSPRRVDLRNATVRVPAMPTRDSCPGGELRFSSGNATDSAGCVWRIAAVGVRYVDLDGKSGEEMVTTIDAGEPNSEFTAGVIGLSAPVDGVVQPMGYVLSGANSAQHIDSLAAAKDGLITVGISDSSRSPEDPQHQTRGYRWTGAGFTQVDGPTAFPEPGGDPSEPPPSNSPSPATGE